MSQLRRTSHAQGFTLVELMITIFVAAILVTLALPSFREVLINNRVTSSTNQLVADLQLARSEAVNRGTLVAVVSNSGTNDWSGGWQVIADSVFKNDGTFTDSADAILRASAGVDTAGNYSVRTKVTTAAAGGTITPTDGTLIFTSRGNLVPNAASFDINVCRPDSQPARSKRISISTAGTITTTIGTGASPAPGC
ncbi:MAG: GspH/FimT family pseudopilin [Proteobacteria bacterium]|nr:GspH/FimT family pseudopilin [Pseudomonadota bacterium]